MFVRTLLVLALLAGPALAADPPAPASPNALWFRARADTEPPRVVEGYVDESKGEGKGFDRFVVDVDGPEKPWKVVPIEEPEEGFDQEYALPLRFGKRSYRLELYGLEFTQEQKDGSRLCWMNQQVEGDGVLVILINGQVRLYPDRESARKGKPVSLGGPLRFEVSTSTRGRNSLLTVGVMDGNGARIWHASAGEKERKIRFRLASRQAVVRSGFIDYG